MTIPSSEFRDVEVKPGHRLQHKILQKYLSIAFLMITLLHKPHPLLVQRSMIPRTHHTNYNPILIFTDKETEA